jgi:hypothetical protein
MEVMDKRANGSMNMGTVRPRMIIITHSLSNEKNRFLDKPQTWEASMFFLMDVRQKKVESRDEIS